MCLAHFLQHSGIEDCEIIVIDSGSEQDEKRVCEEFTRQFSGLVYIPTPRETLYAAWNRALERARGRYFINANTDDALHPDALRILSTALEKFPDAALAYGDWIWSDEPNAGFPWNPTFRVVKHEPYRPWFSLFYAFAGCHQFWRTATLKKLGGFDASCRAVGDYEVLCRLISARQQAVYVPMAVSAFYQNPEGLSRSGASSYEEFLSIQTRVREEVKIGDLFEIETDDVRQEADAWLALANKALLLKIPWAEQVTPDVEFAEKCLVRTLHLNPHNRAALRLRRRIQSLIRKNTATTSATVNKISRPTFFERFFVREPKARGDSPVFHP